jgi:predicted ATPase
MLVGRCAERPASPLQSLREIVEAFCLTSFSDRALIMSLAGVGSAMAKLSDGVADVLSAVGAELGVADGVERTTEVHAIYDSLLRWMANLCRRQRVILLLEDLHYATPETEGFLHYALSSRHPSELVIVGAVNPELARPGVKDILRPRDDLPRVATFSLVPLTPDGIRELLITLPKRRLRISVNELPLSPDGEQLAARLYELSGGLPSLVNLLVRETYDRGIAEMNDETGEWTIQRDLNELDGLDSFHLLIQSRLGRYSGTTNVAANELSVAGGTIEFDIFNRLTALEGLAASEAIEQLLEARILSRVDSGVCFETKAIERAVYGAVRPDERADIHERVARALWARAVAENFRIPFGSIAAHLSEVVKLSGRGAARAIAFHFAEGARALRDGQATEAFAAFDTANVVLDTHDLEDKAEFRARLLVAKARAQGDAASAASARALESAGDVAEALGQPELLNSSIAELDAFFERWRRLEDRS